MNGDVYRCGFALASRVRNYGGDLEIATGASLVRDDFEIVLFEGSNPLRYLWYMGGVVFRQLPSMKGVRRVARRLMSSSAATFTFKSTENTAAACRRVSRSCPAR